MEDNYWAWAANNLRTSEAPDQATRERWDTDAKQFDQYASEGRTITGDLP